MKKVARAIKVIAHRGASSLAPENTLSAFVKAVALGYKAIELDVHETKDKQLVVHHDYRLGFPDNGKGLIRNCLYSDIKKLDAGSWFSPKHIYEKIPLLEDLFLKFGTTIDYEIELKGSSVQFASNVVKLARKYKVTSCIEFTSPHTALLCRVKRMNIRFKIGVIFNTYPQWMGKKLGELLTVDYMDLIPADVAHYPINMINKRLVASLHEKGYLVHAADCNTQDDIELAIQTECDQFSTNDLLLVKRLSEKHSDIKFV